MGQLRGFERDALRLDYDAFEWVRLFRVKGLSARKVRRNTLGGLLTQARTILVSPEAGIA